VDLVEVVEADEPVERRGQIICGRWSLPCLRCLAARQIMLQRPSQLLPLDDPISLPRWPAPLLNLFDLPSNRIRIDFGSAVATGGEVVRHLDTAALQWASRGVENIPTLAVDPTSMARTKGSRASLSRTRVAAFVIVPDAEPQHT
jgi:hypothetical protein